MVVARTSEVLALVLEGAQGWDVVEFVRSKEKESGSVWFVPPDEKALSEVAIREYLTRAYKLVESAHEKRRKKLFRRHLAKLQHLYQKANRASELSVARAILHDLAEMQRLLPKPEEELRKEVARLTKLVEKYIGGNDGE